MKGPATDAGRRPLCELAGTQEKHPANRYISVPAASVTAAYSNHNATGEDDMVLEVIRKVLVVLVVIGVSFGVLAIFGFDVGKLMSFAFDWLVSFVNAIADAISGNDTARQILSTKPQS